MKQPDLNRHSMWKVVYDVLQIYKDIWSGNKAFSEGVADLKSYIDAADNAAKGQAGGTTKGITSDKEAAADNAIALVLKLSKLARAYARKVGNNTLFTAVDFEKSALQNTPLDELLARLQGMLDAAVGVKDNLGDYGFTAGSDTAAQAAIDAFAKAAPGTRAAISGRSAITASVPQIMKGGKAELLVLDDLMSSLYAEDEPQMAAAYRAARVVVDAGRGKKGGEDGAAGACG